MILPILVAGLIAQTAAPYPIRKSDSNRIIPAETEEIRHVTVCQGGTKVEALLRDGSLIAASRNGRVLASLLTQARNQFGNANIGQIVLECREQGQYLRVIDRGGTSVAQLFIGAKAAK